ncbi:hypothetical protein GCM10022243_14210 [Saccharothrix violaceirubra]|uniref:Cytochrome P450 n=1 Tax=Saccharothrix violaceirubra TaxID=413306 RepID=A0A7W7WXD9_9PSEU|nr:cytochrome P450 [Saccharothrix violaceirubra]MBB4967295.1 cytochrome P450 [Saccharothrix violaceirubra]
MTTTPACPVARGPRGLPVLGVAAEYFRDPAGYTLRLQEDHGGMVDVTLPKPFVQVTEPEAVDRVLRGNPDNCTRGELYKGFIGYMGRGLLTLDDPQWRPHRKVVQPAFSRTRITADAEEAVAATRVVLERWATRAGQVFDMAADVMAISTRTMGQALIGRDLSVPGLGYDRAAAIASKVMYTRTVFGVNELLPGFLNTRYQRERRWSHRVIDGVVHAAITSRRRSGVERGDALDHLLASDLDEQAIRDDLRTLLLAGTDTTGQALAWTLYELARHPAVRREVEDEVDRVLGDAAPTPATRDELVVTRSAVDEALRLHPPVWQFPRDLIEDDVLAGRSVPGGSTVLLSTYGTHRSAEHWTDPEAFDPSRFRDGSTRHRQAYFPFGGGRRMCIGRDLALATLVTAVAMTTRRFRLTLSSRPVRVGTYITMFPSDGIHVTARERR